MTQQDIQKEISIIREMVEKTRREAAENGHFFIAIGIFSVFTTVLMGVLESFSLDNLILPVLVMATIISGFIGYFTISRQERQEKVKSYSKTICYNILFGCGMVAIMIVFLFPLLKYYSWELTPVLVSLILGVMVYSTGVIFELRFIQWCGSTWWLGAIVMALVKGQRWPSISTMVLCIIIGFILPGYYLNRNYKNRSK